jgi:hypothetical protein
MFHCREGIFSVYVPWRQKALVTNGRVLNLGTAQLRCAGFYYDEQDVRRGRSRPPVRIPSSHFLRPTEPQNQTIFISEYYLSSHLAKVLQSIVITDANTKTYKGTCPDAIHITQQCSLIPVATLPSNHLDLPCGRFPTGFPPKCRYVSLVSSFCVVCTNYRKGREIQMKESEIKKEENKDISEKQLSFMS